MCTYFASLYTLSIPAVVTIFLTSGAMHAITPLLHSVTAFVQIVSCGIGARLGVLENVNGFNTDCCFVVGVVLVVIAGVFLQGLL